MSEVLATWDDGHYNERMPKIIKKVDKNYCSLVEWVEQEMPRTDGAIRSAIRGAGPCLPPDVIASIPKEDVKETGKLDVLAFVDESGLTAEILEVMNRRKQLGSKKLVPVYGQLEALTEEALEEMLCEEWDMVIFGAGMDMPDSNDPDDVIKSSTTLLKVFLRILKILVRKPKAAKKLFVMGCDTMSNTPATHSEAGVGITASAFLFGMCNTARMEVPVPIHYVDVEYTVTDEIVDALASEVTRQAGFGENSVRLNARGRFVARMVMAEPRYSSNHKWVTPSHGVVGIGGGNGALGIVMGKYYLERVPEAERATATLKIKFLSRSCTISPENASLWADCQKLVEGTNMVVEQCTCDVSQRSAIEAFVEENCEHLVGFTHSAGILRDGLIMNQTEVKYDECYGPKAWAGLYLHHALEKFTCPNLKWLWMFSSVATYGSPGQSNYSGANSLLDALARHRKALGKPANAMQWAGWGEVGMAAGLTGMAAKRMAESPMPPFSNVQGLQGMDVGLSTGQPVFCVMRYNTKAFFEMNNQESKAPSQRYFKKFWGGQAPAKDLTELDLYETVKNNYKQPLELVYKHFVSGDEFTDDNQ